MIPVRVASREIAAQDVVRLELEPLEGALPSFTAGSHIDLVLGNGLTRQYSLCNAPGGHNLYRIAVLREPTSRGGSQAVHDDLIEGATLQISPPRNLFDLNETADSYLLVAGGIGITPILAMAYRLHAIGKPFGLHYCTRDPARAAFLDELTAAPFADVVHLHFDSDPTTGLSADHAFQDPSSGRRLYVCGPTGFMDFIIKRAADQGWDGDQIHREYFAAAPLTTDQNRPFDLVIASTGQTLMVSPDQTAAQVLEAAGVFVPLSCEQGICGTCLTPVLSGQPEHRDLFQTDEEKQSNLLFTPCCSRAMTPSLTLDL